MKDAGSLLSGNLGWFLIDEAFEVPQLSFTHLGGTLRHVLPDGTVPPRYGLLASNPSPGWLMDVFPVMEEEQEFYAKMVDQYGDMWMPQPGPLRSQFPEKTISYDFAYFPFLAEDNEFLLEKDPGYVRNLINDYKHDPVLLARFECQNREAVAALVLELQQAGRPLRCDAGEHPAAQPQQRGPRAIAQFGECLAAAPANAPLRTKTR